MDDTLLPLYRAIMTCSGPTVRQTASRLLQGIQNRKRELRRDQETIRRLVEVYDD